jgi:hypothetical protein
VLDARELLFAEKPALPYMSIRDGQEYENAPPAFQSSQSELIRGGRISALKRKTLISQGDGVFFCYIYSHAYKYNPKCRSFY